MQTEQTTDNDTSTIENIKYFDTSGIFFDVFGVKVETRLRKKVSASSTEIESVIFSPPMFGK